MAQEAFSDLLVVPYNGIMSTIPEEEPNATEISLALVPPLPAIKYHNSPLNCLSKPSLTQSNYERRVMLMRQAMMMYVDFLFAICCFFPFVITFP